MRPLPIRWKFARWTALASGLTVSIFALGTLGMLYRSQIDDVDRQLKDEAQEFGKEIAGRGESGVVDPDIELSWVLFGPDGKVRRADSRLPESLARQMVGSRQVQAKSERGISWRMIARPVPAGTLVVGYNLAGVDEEMADLLGAYALAAPLVALAAALGGWWVAGRALRPLRDLASAAEAIQFDRLNPRLPLPPVEDEIRRLVATLNAMLVRLEKSVEPARRFAADASHELRTPLTIMRGEIEIMLRAPAAPGNEEKLLSLQEEIARLDRITEQLLLLARFDAGQVALERQPVDFSRLVADVCEDAELLTATHQVALERAIAPDARVLGDAQQLRRLLLNLLDNAAKYNRSGGTVWCTLTRRDDAAVLRIANTGAGIPPDLRPLIFQRVFRTDGGRATRPGHGLGLSLCREIALAHGGTLELVEAAPPAATAFQFTLGAAPLG